MRTEPCVCGGIIQARSLREAQSAILGHNMSLTHVVWRFGREGPTAAFLIDDVSRCDDRASVPLVRRTR